MAVSVSHSTRQKRAGEVDGVDYHFISMQQFEVMIDDNAFIEYARVFDNYYGTSRNAIEMLLNSDRDIILEIDWQGAQQVKQKMPETVSIYILPPSRTVLKQRLMARATDDPSIIARRMQAADREMSHYNDAEYLVINENFKQALYDLECIIHSQRMRLMRQKIRNRALIDSIPQEIASMQF